MRQILQDMARGAAYIAEAPAPAVGPETLLIHSTVSLISAGTERMLVDFGRASYLEKARQQPDKVRMVLDKIRTDGLMTTQELQPQHHRLPAQPRARCRAAGACERQQHGSLATLPRNVVVIRAKSSSFCVSESDCAGMQRKTPQ